MDILENLPIILESEEEASPWEEWLDQTLASPISKAAEAKTQEAYEQAFDETFAALDLLNRELGNRTFLGKEGPGKADVRLYSLLARFDCIYFFAFRLNLHKIRDYENLTRYVRELYALPAFREQTDFEKMRRDFYGREPDVANPYHLVMCGPDMSYWTSP